MNLDPKVRAKENVWGVFITQFWLNLEEIIQLNAILSRNLLQIGLEIVKLLCDNKMRDYGEEITKIGADKRYKSTK